MAQTHIYMCSGLGVRGTYVFSALYRCDFSRTLRSIRASTDEGSVGITELGDMNLNRLDLNLLVALDALLVERSITRAAERLHLSPSATSGALARLREFFGWSPHRSVKV
jgi:hypothetical protein